MHKRVLSMFLIISVLISMFPTSVNAKVEMTDFWSKTEFVNEVPEGYVGIYEESQLKEIENNPRENYILMEDIILEGDFTPLCSIGNPFQGILDGNGHEISGLNISRNITDAHRNDSFYIGLFAALSNAQIVNLKISGSILMTMNISGGRSNGNCYIGSLAGRADENITIANCVSNVEIQMQGSSCIFVNQGCGGFLGGYYSNGQTGNIFQNCNMGKIRGNVESPVCYSAGIVGNAVADDGKLDVMACVNMGDITTGSKTGGIVAYAEGNVKIDSCANRGNIEAPSFAGGIVSEMDEDCSVEDCINIGSITGTAEWSQAGGIAERTKGKIIRCLNIGEGSARLYGNIVMYITDKNNLIDSFTCCGISYCTYHMTDNDDDLDNMEEKKVGQIAEEQLLQEETFTNFSFPEKWTMCSEMGYPYPTALLSVSIENIYKTKYVEAHQKYKDVSMKYLEIMNNSGAGSMAGMIGSVYDEAILLSEGNQLWEMMNELSDLLSLKVDFGNDYNLVLMDLMASPFSKETYSGYLNDEILDALSEILTYFQSAVDANAAIQLEEIVDDLGELPDVFNSEFDVLARNARNIITSKATMQSMSNAFSVLGSIFDITDVVIKCGNDIGKVFDYYVLCTAYANANRAYVNVLKDSAKNCEYLGHPLLSAAYSQAVNKFANSVENAANHDYEVLFWECEKELTEMSLGIEGTFARLCYNFDPYVALGEVTYNIGMALMNEVTSMDKISFYGKMIHMTGFAAEGMHQVVIERQNLFEMEPTYDNAEALSVAIEMYLDMQILMCDYAIGYYNTIYAADHWDKFFHTGGDKIEAILTLQVEKTNLMKFKECGRDIYISPDGTIAGFVAACPVIVIVETKDGEELVRMETGKLTINQDIGGNFILTGDEGEHKAGFFEPEKHNLILQGVGEGRMNLLIYYAENGIVTDILKYQNLLVKDDISYRLQEKQLINQDGEVIENINSNSTQDASKEEKGIFERISEKSVYIGAIAAVVIIILIIIYTLKKRKKGFRRLL